MFVGGLKQLGLAPSPAPANGQKSSSIGGQSSFGEVLDQSSADRLKEKQIPAKEASVKEAPVKEAPVKQEPVKEASEKETPSRQYRANGLPVQPGVPLAAVPLDPMMSPVPSLQANSVASPAPFINTDDSIDSLTRRVVWNDFLNKMKEELGVSVEDVLGAFASLSAEDLAKPPAESVDKMVMALGLNDQQALVAKQLFQNLIEKTDSKSLGDEISASEKQISLTLMSQREMQRKALQKSLAQMNDGFFLKNQPQPLTAAPLTEPNAAVPAAIPAMESSRGRSGALPTSGMTPVAKSEAIRVDEMSSKFLSSQSPSNIVKAAPGEMPAQPAVMSESVVPKMTVPDSDFVLPKMTGAQETTAATAASVSASALSALMAEGRSDRGETEDQGEFTSDAYYMGALGEAQAQQSNGSVSSDFKTQLIGQEPKVMAVPDVIQQAQVMIRDGGGEMKVTLNQDGLGEVAMKVSVDQGKVNVQMITESDEARKLIERQLGDLKSQLNHNNLQLDSIKIDTATNLGKQLEQQYQDAQRQQQQAFMEQFRQENQGWRQSFFEPPAQRFYKSQGQAVRDVSAPMDPGARSRSSRRLDLVA